MSNHARFRAAIAPAVVTAVASRAACALIGACCVLVACAPAPRESTFDSPVPGGRLDAIDNALSAWRADHHTLPEATRYGLVECLRSDDPLVRFEAIGALREITVETRGYRYDDPAALRDDAIATWVEWAVEWGKSAKTEHTP